MSRSSEKTIAITMGDPRGIGAEVICKALKRIARLPSSRQGARRATKRYHFIIIGNKKELSHLPPAVTIIDVPYKSAGEGSLKFLDKAIALIKGGVADALVTAPLAKEAVSRYCKNFVGHTEYLAQAFGIKNFDMMFVAPDLRLTVVTRHVPLKDVPKLITQKNVFDSIVLMADTLKDKFKIKNPRIAVFGLNPHAGEGGLLGVEDMKYILPAVRKAKARGINAVGPLPADTFFAFHKPRSNVSLRACLPAGRSCLLGSREAGADEAIFFDGIKRSNCFQGNAARGGGYDGVIAMYHDQGLTPIKGLHMKELVNFTAGLPFVRTSPAHGTAFDIAGKNKADPSSMLAAIKLACQLS